MKTYSIVLFPDQVFSSNVFEEKKNTMVLTSVNKFLIYYNDTCIMWIKWRRKIEKWKSLM